VSIISTVNAQQSVEKICKGWVNPGSLHVAELPENCEERRDFGRCPSHDEERPGLWRRWAEKHDAQRPFSHARCLTWTVFPLPRTLMWDLLVCLTCRLSCSSHSSSLASGASRDEERIIPDSAVNTTWAKRLLLATQCHHRFRHLQCRRCRFRN
jgi:hypothetical protein